MFNTMSFSVLLGGMLFLVQLATALNNSLAVTPQMGWSTFSAMLRDILAYKPEDFGML